MLVSSYTVHKYLKFYLKNLEYAIKVLFQPVFKVPQEDMFVRDARMRCRLVNKIPAVPHKSASSMSKDGLRT